MRLAPTIAALAGALLLTSCGSKAEDAPRPSSEPAKPSATVQAAACDKATPISDPDLAAIAAALQLPAGAQVVTGRVSTSASKPGKVGVALDLCVPGSSSAEALRPIATSIAKALKPTPLGQKTFALYVSDMGGGKTEAKLKDGDYAMHLWNGKPSPEAELALWQDCPGGSCPS